MVLKLLLPLTVHASQFLKSKTLKTLKHWVFKTANVKVL